ncbi:hypothetical protein F5887DRAFT_322431 [Amanita rubescens]|nr:hypothetical protein F5887DRAFT_322431 [Amanita rubescens]
MESDNATSFQEQVVKGIQRLHARLSQCASLLPHPGQDIESKISQHQDDITFHPGENVSDETGMLAAGPLGQGESPIQIDEPTSHKVGSPEVDLPEAPKSDLNGLSAVHQSPEKIKVPTLIRGLLHPGTVKIDFDIKVGIHSALLRWTRRLSPTWNVNDAICVSLGCYNATETALKAVSSKSGRDWRDFISSHQPSWPQTGGLQLLLNGGKRYDLPLSPPLTTQDGLVDLSPYLVEGANGIELHSTRDMSKYVFALVLHPPTPGQLAWKSEQCKMEKDWKDWIKILTQPFNLNPVPFKR